jgi:hypothetical protein
MSQYNTKEVRVLPSKPANPDQFVFRHVEIQHFLKLEPNEQLTFVAESMSAWGTGIEVADLYRRALRVQRKYMQYGNETFSLVKPFEEDPDLLPWRGDTRLQSLLKLFADTLPPTVPSLLEVGKYMGLFELATAAAGATEDRNEHHPKFIWQLLWPKLEGMLVEKEMPDHIAQALSIATCTDLKTVHAEVARRVLGGRVKAAEKKLRETLLAERRQSESL